ncbi:MAG: M14 family metallopeptidase [Cyclobacteriaceae bacterium]
MRNLIILLFLIAQSNLALGQSDYFYPSGQNFDPNIPSPEEFLGYPIGEFHTRHDRIVSYFEMLAEKSDKATLQVIGKTYEQRPQIVLTVTSPENHGNLESIRQEHLKISDPSQTSPDVSAMPVVMTLGFNVHGNEPSSSEAALLTAYYIVASNTPEAEEYRKNAVIFIDPVYNPDGRDRHTNWANMHRGDPKVADPWDREHNEVWPSGRVNHYWFDLNRDWLPLVHPESKARIDFYHQWLPNMVTDFHEMGTNSTYFFEPTKPFGSENPLVPRTNYDKLNNLMAKYFSRNLDEIGSLYFTKEVFDNSYPGYGSTYPDIHGGLGLVFEQASSRGHLQQSRTRQVEFRFTIRNHLRSALATIEGTVKEKDVFLKHQREFFESAISDANADPVKAYIFGEQYDQTRLNAFLELALRHNIKVYSTSQSQQQGGLSYQAGKSYIIPTNQPQYRMVKSMFEKVKSFHDSVFYDASAWSMALAYGIDHTEIKTTRFQLEEQINEVPSNTIDQKQATYAYLLDSKDLNVHKALYHLLKNEVYVHVGLKPFAATVGGQTKSYSYGSLVVSVVDQDLAQEEIHQYVKEAAALSGLEFDPVGTGMSVSGIDLGSGNFRPIDAPKAMMIVGEGVYLYEAGEIWHLLDTKVGMPITKVDKIDLPRVNLNDYTTIVMVHGNYNDLSDSWVADLKRWVGSGGTLITQKSATSWAINKELSISEFKTKNKEENEDVPRLNYATAQDARGAQRIGGSIYELDLDITHPIGFGYQKEQIPVYRNSTIFLKPSQNEFSTVGQYTSSPWLSGYISADNLELVKNSASIVVSPNGNGRVIQFTDNPNFRGTWLGTSKLFLNALFYGALVRVP